ncbi:MAG: hypothetical protein DCC68_05170 [Planctomycetota bacterium]|nr:MAG: hypothetical protein DCC68_05170 [Planctomycetota bacterium]
MRKSARQFAGRFGFKRQDRDEVEQQLYLKLARHLHAADAGDPRWKAFVARVVRRYIANMIRDNLAAKRDHRRVSSIHIGVGDKGEGRVELADTIDSQRNGCRSASKRSPQDLADLKLDVAACMADVSDERLREFAERLKHDSISQVARDMGIPRTTLNSWLGKLRRRFEDRSLQDYV